MKGKPLGPCMAVPRTQTDSLSCAIEQCSIRTISTACLQRSSGHCILGTDSAKCHKPLTGVIAYVSWYQLLIDTLGYTYACDAITFILGTAILESKGSLSSSTKYI